MTSSATSMHTEPRFQCILTNDLDKEPNKTEPLYFEQEDGKKSSFLLNLDDDAARAISKPAHVIITCYPHDKFLFGGLELVSNARNVEIYLTDQHDKETYLTTCRGIVAGEKNAESPTFKCLVVCPGGPRPVLRIHLKLLSLKPEFCTGASLHLMKLKGRLPPPKQQQEATTDSSSTSTSRQAPPTTNNTPALTQADMGAAMAGVSMLVRSVESSLLRSVQASLDRMEKRFDERFNRIEQYLMLQQQQALIQQQQQQERYNSLETQLVFQMKEQRNELVSLIGSLLAQPRSKQEETCATTDKVDEKVQSETIKESKAVEDGNDEEAVSEKVKSAPSVSCEVSSENENEFATDKATDKVSAETTEQDDKVGTSESGSSFDTNEKEILEDESCADKEAEDEGSGSASTMDSNDEREDCNTEKVNVGAHTNVNVSDIKSDHGADPSVQSGGVLNDGEMKGSDETLSDDQSDTPEEEKQSSTDQPDVISGSEKTLAATNSSSSQPEKQPIMNQRADAWEIPDVLPDTTGSQVTAAVSNSSVSIEHQAQDEVS